MSPGACRSSPPEVVVYRHNLYSPATHSHSNTKRPVLPRRPAASGGGGVRSEESAGASRKRSRRFTRRPQGGTVVTPTRSPNDCRPTSSGGSQIRQEESVGKQQIPRTRSPPGGGTPKEGSVGANKKSSRQTPTAGMGQRLARQEMDTGVKLYHMQRHKEAVEKWRRALKRLKSAEDRFITLGYLAQALSESGAFAEMLTFAMHQIDLANRHNDDYMKAEAYLNLARANQRLAHFNKAIAYGRHSLQHLSMDPRTPGYAQLCIANAHLGFGQLQLSLDAYECAMRVAQQCQDALLELQICVGLGQLFTQIRDLAKAVVFLQNALSLLTSVTIQDVHAKYKSLILYHLSVALRRSGSIVDAKAACDEALRLATENGNRPIQARCLSSIADIHRELGELDKSWSRYDAAFEVMKETGDRLGQVIVLASMAKTSAERRRHDLSQCECQAIQLNKRCLETCKAIGAKLYMLKCHGRLHRLYQELQDDESEEVASKAITALVQELELFCNFCGQRYGTKDETLQALRCSHVYHERCLHNHLSQRENKECPKCQHRAILDVSSGSCAAGVFAPPPPSYVYPRTSVVSAGGCSRGIEHEEGSLDLAGSEADYDNQQPSTSSAFHSFQPVTAPAGRRLTPPPRRAQSPVAEVDEELVEQYDREHFDDDDEEEESVVGGRQQRHRPPSAKLDDWLQQTATSGANHIAVDRRRADSPGPSRLVTQLLDTAAHNRTHAAGTTVVTAATIHAANQQQGNMVGGGENRVLAMSQSPRAVHSPLGGVMASPRALSNATGGPAASPPPQTVLLAPLGRSNSANTAANFLVHPHAWTVTDV